MYEKYREAWWLMKSDHAAGGREKVRRGWRLWKYIEDDGNLRRFQQWVTVWEAGTGTAATERGKGTQIVAIAAN
jgi:hypothetical protein